MLHYYPAVRQQLEVRTIPFERPRPEIAKLLGEANQSCPCLVLADPTKAEGLPIKRYLGKTFLDDHRAILEYLARNYNTSRPAHD